MSCDMYYVLMLQKLTQKYYNGIVPQPDKLFQTDSNVLESLKKAPAKIDAAIESYKFREALSEFMEVARIGNKYLADNEPWKLVKEDEVRVKTIMYTALQLVANIAVMGSAFLPKTSHKLFGMIRMKPLNWSHAGKSDLMTPGHKLEKPSLLFEKIEDAVIQNQIDKLEATKKSNQMDKIEVTPSKEEIVFDDFTKLDMRVGTILEAEKVPKSKKLLKLKVDTGIDTRTVLSGIAQHYDADAIIGKQVTILINLAPRKIMGELSQGMILMAEDSEGKLSFISPNINVNSGSAIS